MSPSANEFAAKYLEDLLSFFGLNTKVETLVEEHTVELQVPSSNLNGFLIGQRGENLRSLQHLTNMAMKRAGFDEMVAVIDVAGYRAQQNQRLAKRAVELAGQVASSGEDYTFDFLSAYERRVVHKALGEVAGITTESVGEGRDRRLVIKQA
jgi:spoIIIJ-associated protein